MVLSGFIDKFYQIYWGIVNFYFKTFSKYRRFPRIHNKGSTTNQGTTIKSGEMVFKKIAHNM